MSKSIERFRELTMLDGTSGFESEICWSGNGIRDDSCCWCESSRRQKHHGHLEVGYGGRSS